MAKPRNPQSASIEEVKAKHEQQLMRIEGVQGVGIGDISDRPVIKIYVARKTKFLQQQLPTQLEGYPVTLETSGEFDAQ